ncbi:MAG: hypothetical protein RIC29_18185 [Rhodospirillaceae bacterium]
MSTLQTALLYATLAGITIPLGGLCACFENIRSKWLEQELRHSVIAFGGGVLFAAIALVLVPEGMANVSLSLGVAMFVAGGVVFFVVDRAIQSQGGAGAQLMAMLLDFVPESMALGAMLATQNATALLLAGLIALQNFPEGFNAYRELVAGAKHKPRVILLALWGVVVLGPLSAWLGYEFLRASPQVLGAIMLFAAGGILYLTFQDIAPQARLKHHWAPSLAAVAGFTLGLLGDGLVHA